MRAAAAIALSLLAVGCLAPAAVETGMTGDVPSAAGAALVAHAASGLLPLPPEFADLAFRLAPTGAQRGEPTVGVTSTGTIFAVAGREAAQGLQLQGQTFLARSRDHGATWDILMDARMGKVDGDPWVWVDRDTDRVFHVPLYVACSWLAWSDDEGETWDANPVAGCGTPGHDHQKVTTGPPPAGVATSGYPNVVYYAYNSFRDEGTMVSVSLDGGRTFGRDVLAVPQDDCHAGINGPVAVAADGTAYLPKPVCDGVVVAVSRDAGATWEVGAKIPGGTNHLQTIDAAVDAAGNAYVVFTGEDQQIYLSSSEDGGRTWSAPARASPPGVTATVFSVVTAGADGRVALAYLGTSSPVEGWTDPSDAPPTTVWHAYLAYAEDALAADPVFVTLRVTPEDDPAQIGCVWLRGGVNECRNLRDFIDLVHHNGRPYLVFADGCPKCSDAAGSRRLGETVVAIAEGGPSLLGGLLPALPAPGAHGHGAGGPAAIVEELIHKRP